VVTEPDVTPLLAAARALGCAIQTGKEMARGQIEAIVQFFGLLGGTSPAPRAEGVFSQ
jgi:shikimate dehydrogenase